MADQLEGGDRALLAGAAGLIGALAVGAGEALIQWSPGANYADPQYSYFLAIGPERLNLGHFISILAAPLYLLGYWHLTRNLAPGRPRLSAALFAAGAYGFIVGAVWLGQRYFLARAVQIVDSGEAGSGLIADFAAHNEPLVNVLRAVIALFSIAWIALIGSGQSRYPRWVAIFSPFALLALIFGLGVGLPAIAGLVLPVAMNAAHVVVFGLSLAVLAGRGGTRAS